MAIHSSILAWEIPWTEEPGGLQHLKYNFVNQLYSKKKEKVIPKYQTKERYNATGPFSSK